MSMDAKAQAEFEAEVRRQFLSETEEMLANTESDFLRLEKEPGNAKLVQSIFRLAHTIKGSALMVGFTELAAFAHVFESVLVEIRDGRLPPQADVIETLLRSNDVLTKFTAALRVDMTATLDTRDVLEALNCHLSVTRIATATGTEAAAAAAEQASGEKDDGIIWVELPTAVARRSDPVEQIVSRSMTIRPGSRDGALRMSALAFRAAVLHSQLASRSETGATPGEIDSVLEKLKACIIEMGELSRAISG